jgi:hypothetical protein
MRKLLSSALGLAILVIAMSAPALAFPAASVVVAGQSASPIVRADYYYEHHRYHHRRWDDHYHHWHYYD